MTTLEEKMQAILDGSDFNDLPFEERKRICKYLDEKQILTIWQTLERDKHLTTEAWKKSKDNGLKTAWNSTDGTIVIGLMGRWLHSYTMVTKDGYIKNETFFYI